MKWAKTLLLLVLLIPLLLLGGRGVFAQSIDELQRRIQEYEQELARLSQQARTLSNQIRQFDAQIRLTTTKIAQTEVQISDLRAKIGRLEVSIGTLSDAFSQRAVETYKTQRLGDPLITLLTAVDLNQLMLRMHYLRLIQEHDRDLLVRLQTAQTNYEVEKEEFEALQKKLEEQKAQLARQRQEKAAFLQVTRNDERRYQQLLAEARAELAVVLGQGKETFLRDVGEGEVIGRIISTASGCSSGPHLHFEVHKNGNVEDPNNYLGPSSFSYSYNPDQYGYYGTINPHGGWNWPLNGPIQINQGYGATGYAQSFYPDKIHRGFDMYSPDTVVKAVKPGKLYGGSYTCGGIFPGVLLYAKVEQSDGIVVWYLHITPQ